LLTGGHRVRHPWTLPARRDQAALSGAGRDRGDFQRLRQGQGVVMPGHGRP
jgi:hypothetical protein